MTQIINWSGDFGDGVCIGGDDPNDTNHTPLRTMSNFGFSFQNNDDDFSNHLFQPNTMNQLDESDIYKLGITIHNRRGDELTRHEQLDGTSADDLITINQRPRWSNERISVRYATDIYAGKGDDIIAHNHHDRNENNVYTVSRPRVWGGEGRDSFSVRGNHKHFMVMDMEVGETIAVDGRFERATEDARWGGYGGRDTNVRGEKFFNFEDAHGNDSHRTGVWLNEGTELVQISEGRTSVFMLVEV